MIKTRDWRRTKAMWISVLEKRTGEGLNAWNRRIRKQTFDDARQLRVWLSGQNVSGYAQQLLVMEHSGYPEFILATAEELIEKQYANCPQLRAIYDAIIDAAAACGEVTVQARKTYVSLIAPRRTFARVQRTTKTRVDLLLRLAGQRPGGRLQPSNIHETMRLQISLATPDEVDSEVQKWLRRAYVDNS